MAASSVAPEPSVSERPALWAGRDHQSIHRDEFAHRRRRLIEAAEADGGRRWLQLAHEALGAFCLLWYSGRIGHRDGRLRADEADICRMLGNLDRRRWRCLAKLLAAAGLLVAATDGGWVVPDCVRLRGSSRTLAAQTAGFLWTDPKAYAKAVEALRAQLSGRRAPLLLLGLLGTWETLRVLKINFRTAKVKTTGPQLRQQFGLSANAMDTRIGLLVAAGLLERPRRGLLAVPPALWHGLQNLRSASAAPGEQRGRDEAEGRPQTEDHPAKNGASTRAKNGASTQSQGVGFVLGGKPPSAPPPAAPIRSTSEGVGKSPKPSRPTDPPPAQAQAPGHPATGEFLAAVTAVVPEAAVVLKQPWARKRASEALEQLVPAGSEAHEHAAAARALARALTRASLAGAMSAGAVLLSRLPDAGDSVRRDLAARAAARADRYRARDAAVAPAGADTSAVSKQARMELVQNLPPADLAVLDRRALAATFGRLKRTHPAKPEAVQRARDIYLLGLAEQAPPGVDLAEALRNDLNRDSGPSASSI